MSKIKVSTLEGQSLNDQVAKALGWEIRQWGDTPVWFQADGEKRFRCMVKDWKPSTNWAQGGLIIEQEDICLTQTGDANSAWSIHYMDCAYGQTPLIAAMRLYVASKVGEEVDE